MKILTVGPRTIMLAKALRAVVVRTEGAITPLALHLFGLEPPPQPLVVRLNFGREKEVFGGRLTISYEDQV
jgi:hypothetical protein